MMRALWTGASGMKSNQTSVDTVANNIANVDTTFICFSVKLNINKGK